jgi:thiosulfate/3-mercaptopyruvate sulfurtransferase
MSRSMLVALLAATLLTLTGTALARSLEPLVSVEWLQGHLGEEGLVVIDIRSAIDSGARSDFEAGHIPGAVYSSYTEAGWRQNSNGVPGMVPPVSDLEALIGGLGIDNHTDVVIVPAGVGSTDFGSAARIYWTFKLLGHDRVAILNGGHLAWVESGAPVAEGWQDPQPTRFVASFRPHLLASVDDVARAPAAGIQLVDNRPADQFAGQDQHPAARAAGTIPGARNLQQQHLTREGTAFLLDETAIASLMAQASISRDQQTITFCNTGHWAALGWFAMSEIAGVSNVAMYDGSMVEWAQDVNRPLQIQRTGLAGLIDRFRN